MSRMLWPMLSMRKGGVVSWPPEWRAVIRESTVVQGEVGILDDVSMHDRIANKIFMAMEQMDERYIAVLSFDDETFTKQLYLLLIINR